MPTFTRSAWRWRWAVCLQATMSAWSARVLCVCAKGPGHIFGVVAVKKEFHLSSVSLNIPVSWNYSKQANSTISAELATWCKVLSISFSPSGAARLKPDESGSEAGQNIQNQGRCQTHQEATAIFGIWQDCNKADGQSPFLPDPRLLQHESMCGSCGPWALYSFPWSKSMVVQSMSGGLLIWATWTYSGNIPYHESLNLQ